MKGAEMSMISRQVAELREWSEHENLVEENRMMADLLFKAADTIEMLSEKARGQAWIPCEERLPNTSRDVLTYRPNMGMPMLVDRYDRYYGEDDNEYYEEWAYGGDRVVAWMELPKPWKGADDE